jgi:RimJ/RimL family protein N-acetyltransferase
VTPPTAHIPTLTTERLTLRAPGPQDLPAFAAFYASDAARFVGGPMTTAETWRYLCQVLGHWTMRGYGRWIVTLRDDDAAIGLVGLHNPMDWPEAEVGWYIWSGTGKGYASEAARAARNHAYTTLGWQTAISMIAAGNDASVRVAASMGATRQDDFHHPVYGAMAVYRHPAPQALT